MLHPVSSYLSYLFASKNQYGVHSPFLYEYLTMGLGKKTLIDLDQIKLLRKNLKENKNEISITDFGAGSKRLKNNKRRISDIAKTAGISKKRGRLLAKTTNYFRPGSILEIGTSLGLSTAYMAAGAPMTSIVTLEGCASTAAVARDNFRFLDLKNIQIETGEFNKSLSKVLSKNSFDLIYFDGNHQKDPTIHYFEECLKTAHQDSIFIFDDIHWSADMEQAWNYIKNHERVTLSVDTFKWGLVFFKKGRVKEHFTLRI